MQLTVPGLVGVNGVDAAPLVVKACVQGQGLVVPPMPVNDNVRGRQQNGEDVIDSNLVHLATGPHESGLHQVPEGAPQESDAVSFDAYQCRVEESGFRIWGEPYIIRWS